MMALGLFHLFTNLFIFSLCNDTMLNDRMISHCELEHVWQKVS